MDGGHGLLLVAPPMRATLAGQEIASGGGQAVLAKQGRTKDARTPKV